MTAPRGTDTLGNTALMHAVLSGSLHGLAIVARFLIRHSVPRFLRLLLLRSPSSL